MLIVLLLLLRRLLLLLLVAIVLVVGFDALRGCLILLAARFRLLVLLGGLRFLESLVLTVRPIAVLDDERRLCHLPIVGILLVAPVVVLYDDGRRSLLVLLLHAAFAALVRSICLLDALGCLVQLSLLAIIQLQVGKVRLEWPGGRI